MRRGSEGTGASGSRLASGLLEGRFRGTDRGLVQSYTRKTALARLRPKSLIARSEPKTNERKTEIMIVAAAVMTHDPARGGHAVHHSAGRVVDPFKRTLERLSPRARAWFIEGWRILCQETGR